jgi:hypothetical protein
MSSLLARALAAVRVWLGVNDPSENHLHASHGWLLPPAASRRAELRGRALTLATVPATSPTRDKGR